jgi:hypothetical protein
MILTASVEYQNKLIIMVLTVSTLLQQLNKNESNNVSTFSLQFNNYYINSCSRLQDKFINYDIKSGSRV